MYYTPRSIVARIPLAFLNPALAVTVFQSQLFPFAIGIGPILNHYSRNFHAHSLSFLHSISCSESSKR